MPPHITAPMRITLQIEGALIAALAIAGFASSGISWGLFAVLILAPDLAMLGYLGGPRLGALAYNLAHSYSTPIAVIALGWLLGWPMAWPVACIWIAHIAVDRAIGYGLKYAQGFKLTHLSTASPTEL